MQIKKPTLVVAYDKNRGIGIRNDLPWRGDLPADMQHFREVTRGGVVLMGRKTFDSIGKLLPGRENRVLSRGSDIGGGVLTYGDFKEAIEMNADDTRELFVIGGSEIYQRYLSVSAKIIATEIDWEFMTDTYFPTLKAGRWSELERTYLPGDEKNVYPYAFVTYQRQCGDFIDTTKARNEAQREQFEQIEIDGTCPFCPEHLSAYHKGQLDTTNEHWTTFENMIPYEGSSLHKVFVPTRHVEHPAELVPEEWAELGKVVDREACNVPYGGLAMRFGPTSKTGASVAHLHAHLIKPIDGSDESRKVRFKISR